MSSNISLIPSFKSNPLLNIDHNLFNNVMRGAMEIFNGHNRLI